MTTTVLTSIGRLVTHDLDHGPSHPAMTGAGCGLDDAWIVLGPPARTVHDEEEPGPDGDRAVVLAHGTGRPPSADRRVDLGGRAVLPGFVDSHTHLVFAGDRAAEFSARMSGTPYDAGGIATTIAATRAADDDTLRTALARRLTEARRQGITTLEIKSGYGATVADEARSLRLAGEVTRHTTFLGAHLVPPDAPSADEYVDLVVGEMLEACAPLAESIDVFCERGAFDVDQCREVLAAGAAAWLVPRVHANQLGHGPGVQLAVEVGAASADHCTHLTDEDVEALAGNSGRTVATLLPATDFSTRQPYPDGRRLVDAGATVALATNCNPGSSHTLATPFVIALAVRDCGLTVDEAVWALTAGGAASLRRTDVGHLRVGARADLVVLEAPSPAHLPYRPGMPMVAATLRGGVVVADTRPRDPRARTRRSDRGAPPDREPPRDPSTA